MPLLRPSRPSRRAAVALAGFAVILVVGGCTSSSSSTAVPLQGSLVIEELQPAGGPTWKPGGATCVELGVDPQETIAVVLQTDSSEQLVVGTPNAPDWTLTPPLACVGTPQCGYVALTVDTCESSGTDAGSENTTACVPDVPERTVLLAAGSTISVAMSTLTKPTGLHRFRAQLVNSDGTVPTNVKGQPFTDEVLVDVERHCGPPAVIGGPDAAAPDAGADAATEGGISPRDGGSNDASTDAAADAARVRDAAKHD